MMVGGRMEAWSDGGRDKRMVRGWEKLKDGRSEGGRDGRMVG